VELAERLQELRADRRHGASFLARRAAEALVEVAEAPAATSEELLERVLAPAVSWPRQGRGSPPWQELSDGCSRPRTPRRISRRRSFVA